MPTTSDAHESEDETSERKPRAPRSPSFVHVNQLSDLIAEARRYPHGVARADLVESLFMGRNAVDRRLKTAVEMGLLEPAGRGMSTGGRAPEMWRFNPAAATLLALSVSYRTSTAALMSLGGEVLERVTWDEGIINDPDVTVRHAIAHLTALQRSRPDLPAPWAVGVSLPIPVDFRDGSIVMPLTGEPNQTPWTGYPVRSMIAKATGLATWIDDEVNVLALAAATRVGAPGDLLYVRLSLGLGMGIVSGGQVHRGVAGASGEISHIQVSGAGGTLCRCGRRGCLETVISGASFEKEASKPQALHHSPYLREVMSEHNQVLDRDVFSGVAQGDRVCVRIVTEGADRLAIVLAVLATTYNPGEIVLGGDVAASGQHFAQVVSTAVRHRVLPSTSARLRVRMGHPDDALIGAARMASDWILSPWVLYSWMPKGSPIGLEELITHRRQDA